MGEGSLRVTTLLLTFPITASNRWFIARTRLNKMALWKENTDTLQSLDYLWCLMGEFLRNIGSKPSSLHASLAIFYHLQSSLTTRAPMKPYSTEDHNTQPLGSLAVLAIHHSDIMLPTSLILNLFNVFFWVIMRNIRDTDAFIPQQVRYTSTDTFCLMNKYILSPLHILTFISFIQLLWSRLGSKVSCIPRPLQNLKTQINQRILQHHIRVNLLLELLLCKPDHNTAHRQL